MIHLRVLMGNKAHFNFESLVFGHGMGQSHIFALIPAFYILMSTIVSSHPFLFSAPIILPTPSQTKLKSSYNNKITITHVPNLSGEHPKKTNSCSYAHPF